MRRKWEVESRKWKEERRKITEGPLPQTLPNTKTTKRKFGRGFRGDLQTFHSEILVFDIGYREVDFSKTHSSLNEFSKLNLLEH